MTFVYGIMPEFVCVDKDGLEVKTEKETRGRERLWVRTKPGGCKKEDP